MTEPELTATVKKLALANHLDYVGISSADRLQDEPERRKPADYLPGARAVISIGIKLGQGVMLSNRLAHHEGPRHAIFSYLWYGFGLPSLHYLDRTALLITRLLEKEGYIAIPVMAASPFDIQSNLMEFSNHHAACAAGLGELGFSGMVMTPDAGPRARFSSVITTAPLEPDELYDGPRLCDVESCKKLGQGQPICQASCPAKAIGPERVTVNVAGKSYNVGQFARFRCMWGSMGLLKETLGLKDIPMPEKSELEAADILEALGKRDPSQTLELMVIGRGDYCGQCIMQCPVGNHLKAE